MKKKTNWCGYYTNIFSVLGGLISVYFIEQYLQDIETAA